MNERKNNHSFGRKSVRTPLNKNFIINIFMAFAIAIVSSVTTASIMKNDSSSVNNKTSKHKNKVEITSLMPEINKPCLSKDSWTQDLYLETQYGHFYSDPNPRENDVISLEDKVDVNIYVYDGAIAIDFRSKDNFNINDIKQENASSFYKLKTKEMNGIEIRSNYAESCIFNEELSSYKSLKYSDTFLEKNLMTLNKGDLIARCVFDIPNDILKIDPDFEITVFGHDVNYCKILKK